MDKEFLAYLESKSDRTPEEERALLAHYRAEQEKAIDERVAAQVATKMTEYEQRHPDRSLLITGNEKADEKKNSYNNVVRAGYYDCKRRPIPEEVKTGLVEGTTTAGGYLVNDLYRNELIQSMNVYGDALKLANVIPISTKKELTPKVSTGTTAYWVAEVGSITASDVVLAQPTCVIKKLATLHYMSNEVMEDAAFDIEAMYRYEDAIAMSTKLDAEYFRGADGYFEGILPNSSLATAAAGDPANINFDKMIEGILSVPQAYLAGASVVLHRSVWAKILAGVHGTNNEPLFYQSPNAGLPSTIFGYPVVLAEGMPAVDALGNDGVWAIVANLKRTTRIWLRKDVSVFVSDQGYVNSVSLLETDQVATRTIMRLGIEVVRPAEILAFTTGV